MNKKTTRQIALAIGIASVMMVPAFVHSQSVTAPGSSGAGSVASPSTSTTGVQSPTGGTRTAPTGPVTSPGTAIDSATGTTASSTRDSITSPGSSAAGRVTSPSTGLESPGGRAGDPQTAPIEKVQDPDAPTTTTDVATSDTDRTLNQAIRLSLSEEASLASAFANVHMETEDGTVTLHGSVPTAKERADIVAKVKRTTGVKKVDDQLQIAPASPRS